MSIERIRRLRALIVALSCALAFAGCSDDNTGAGSTDTGSGGDVGDDDTDSGDDDDDTGDDDTDTGDDTGDDDATDTGDDDADTGDDDADVEVGPVDIDFTLEVTNNTTGEYATPLSPGVWMVHTNPYSLPEGIQASDVPGMEALAEWGNPADLMEALATGGYCDVDDGLGDPCTPDGEECGVDGTCNLTADGLNIIGIGTFGAPGEVLGPIVPGASVEFTFQVNEAETDALLTLIGGMYVASNDAFIMPALEDNDDFVSIPLFDGDGPVDLADITDSFWLWDAGTEANEAPRYGANQPLNSSALDDHPNVGSAEGVVRPFGHETRALAPALELIEVQVVDESDDTCDDGDGDTDSICIDIVNISGLNASTWLSFERAVLAQHRVDDTPFDFFANLDEYPVAGLGDSDAADALELLEDVTFAVDSVNDSLNFSADPDALEAYGFIVDITDETEFNWVSFATRVENSTDVLVGSWVPVQIIADGGGLRALEDIEADFAASLVVVDAGLEVNGVIAIGANSGTGVQDAEDVAPAVYRIRETGDSAVYNDLLNGGDDFPFTVTLTELENDNEAGDGPDLSVATFDIDVETDTTLNGWGLSPAVVLIHTASFDAFEVGTEASELLATLATIGDRSGFENLQDTTEGLEDVVFLDDGGCAEDADDCLVFDETAVQMTVLTMVVPSNDAFLATNGIQVATVLDSDVSAREDVNTVIAAALRTYDAGAEANEASTVGPGQQGPGIVGDPADGAAEGDGSLRPWDDSVWNYSPNNQIGDVVSISVGVPASE